MMHLVPFMGYIFTTAATIFYAIFLSYPVMVAIVHSFASRTSNTWYARSAQTEVGGTTDKGSFSRFYFGLSVVAYYLQSSASCLLHCLFLAVLLYICGSPR